MVQEIPFIDVNDKERTGELFFVVEQDGEEFVEVKIVGRVGKWIEWYPLTEFQVRNPQIVLMKKPANFGE
jgi:uncharacterized membrane protein (DUF106 family)